MGRKGKKAHMSRGRRGEVRLREDRGMGRRQQEEGGGAEGKRK